MAFDARWRSLRERCESLNPETALVTPGAERVFVVDRTDEDGVVVRFRDGGERRLGRDQFEELADSVADEPLVFDALPPGVGPYVSLLSLVPGFAVADGRLRATDEADADSPFLRSQWDVRRPPTEVHDDALLVADWLERNDATDTDSLDPESLVDLYVLLSDLQWGADDLRREVGSDLLDHVGPDGRLSGRYGTVSRASRERRRPKDDETVLARLDEAGVPHEWVLGVDEDKLDVVVATTDVDEDDVYDVHEQYHVQKTGVDSAAKRSHLQGLRDRLDELDGAEADEIREEVDHLEARIEALLAAG